MTVPSKNATNICNGHGCGGNGGCGSSSITNGIKWTLNELFPDVFPDPFV